MKLLKSVMIVFCILNFFSCTSRNTVYEGAYKNQKVTVTSIETGGFNVSHIGYELQLGDWKPILIDVPNIDTYGRPYSDDLFGNSLRQYPDTNQIRYENLITFDKETIPTVLYINPKEYNQKTYKVYADFFSHKWPEVEREINKDFVYLNRHVIGTVYGASVSFTRVFKYKEPDGPYFFVISPDGMINYDSGSGLEDSKGSIGTGLADKVQMPGKIILLKDSSSFNRARLRKYKDIHGKSMEDYFKIL